MDSLSDHRGTTSGNRCFDSLSRQESTYEEVPVLRYVHPTRSHSLSILRQRRRAMISLVSQLYYPPNLRRALADRDLLRCKNEYPQFAVRVDDYTQSVMTFRIGQHEKSIKLTNPESDHPSNIAHYP